MQGKSTIQIDVELDDKKHPDKIFWSASDNPGGKDPVSCKAFLLSVFDEVTADTFRIYFGEQTGIVPKEEGGNSN